MSEKKTSWILELVDKITAPLRGVQSGADKTAAAFENANKNAEKMKELMPYSRVINIENGKKVFINDYAHADELAGNKATAEILAKNHDMDVKIPPHTNGKVLVGKSNPEFYFKGKSADAKRVKGYDGISGGFKSAKGQGCSYVVIDFNKHFDTKKTLKSRTIANKIRNRRVDFENNTLDGCYLVFGEKSVYIPKDFFEKRKGKDGYYLSTDLDTIIKELNPN